MLGGDCSFRLWWSTAQLPREAADAPSLEASKLSLDNALGSLIYWLATLPTAGGWNFKDPSNPSSVILWLLHLIQCTFIQSLPFPPHHNKALNYMEKKNQKPYSINNIK